MCLLHHIETIFILILSMKVQNDKKKLELYSYELNPQRIMKFILNLSVYILIITKVYSVHYKSRRQKTTWMCMMLLTSTNIY